MADEPRLVVALEARLNKFESDLRQAGVLADRSVKQIEDRFAKSNPSFGGQFLKGLLGALATGLSVDVLHNIIKSVGDIADQAERVAVSTDALQSLRFAMEQAGGSTSQLDAALARFTVNIGKAADGTSFLARIFTANNVAIRDANGVFKSQEQLLESFAVLVRNAGSEQDRARLATEAFGREGTRLVGTLVEIANTGLAGFIDKSKEAGFVIDSELVKRADEFDKTWSAALNRTSVNIKSFALTILDAVATWVAELEKVELVGRTFQEAMAGQPAAGGTIAGRRAPLQITVTPNPSNAPTVIPPRSAGGGGLDAFERQEEQIRRRIELLETETRSIGQSTEVRERARITTELMVAAEKAQLDITPQLRERIAQLADAYGLAAEQAEKARDRIEAIREASREFGSALAEGFKAAVFEGEKLDQVLRNIVKRLASRGVDAAFSTLFNALGNSVAGSVGGFNPLAGAFSFGGSRAVGGNVQPGNWYMVGENGPEPFVPNTSGTIIPNNVASGAGGGGISVQYSPVIDARGADTAAIARLERVMEQDRRALPARVVSAVNEARRRSVRV